MNRFAYLVLSLGAAGLMIMLLVMTIGAQAPDNVGGTTIKVPDDYATIQAAIDTAEDGETIQVAEGFYKENLAITKAVTLSGGWSADFTTREPGASTIDGQGLGRVISITTDSIYNNVTIDGFTITGGDASGLGPPSLLELSDPAYYTAVSGLPDGSETEALDPAEEAAELRAQVVDLAARGLYPGGERALQSMLELLDWQVARAEDAQTLAETGPALNKAAIAVGPGTGGGVYSWNASLNLLNSTIEFNVGATNGDGYGGGIFAGQAAPGGPIITDNIIRYNTASMYGDGEGGGLYLSHTTEAHVEDNLFLENAASNGGQEGVGGGLYVNESEGALVQGNKFLRNTAHASWDCYGFGGGGAGGGAMIRKSDGAIVKDNLFHNNLSALHCGSHTGGLYVYDAANVQVTDNELVDNWGVLFQVYTDDFGGGLGLDTLNNATVTGNTIRGNTTSLATEDHGLHVSYGGGIYGYALTDSRIASNTIDANTASIMLTAFGGGMYLEATEDVVVAHNLFTQNAAGLSELAGGYGGAMNLRNTVRTLVQGNRFEGNQASAGTFGSAGALYIVAYGPHSIDNTVDGNLFLNNRANGDAAEWSQGGAAVIDSYGFAFTNNVLAGNEAYEAGGLYLGIARNGEITNNTLAGNSDAAIMVDEKRTPVTLTNNIIVDHSVGIRVTEVSTATVSYTLWDGNDLNIDGAGAFTETHPVVGDPVFVDATNNDYHLADGSAAIDAGDPAGVPPAPDHDADGLARPQYSAVDIGAYEWLGSQQYLPVVMNHWQPVIGWAVGESADGYCTILKTVNGGDTWQRQGVPGELPDDLCGSVSAIDAHNAWIVGGERGKPFVLRTRDGGLTWEQQALPEGLPPGVELTWVKALDGNTAWAVGFPDVLLGTTDGRTWEIMPRADDLHLSFPVSYSDVDAVDATHVWAVGSHGLDAGKERGVSVIAFYDGVQWHRQGAGVIPPDRDDTLIGVSVLDEDTVWAVGGWDLPLLKTADGGATWQQAGESLSPDDANRVVVVSADTGWVACDFATIQRTDNGGEKWVRTNTGIGSYVYGITAMDAQTAWAVAPSGTQPSLPGFLLRTRDGQNWEAHKSPVGGGLWSISFVGARR